MKLVEIDLGTIAEFVLGQATIHLESCTWNGCFVQQIIQARAYMKRFFYMYVGVAWVRPWLIALEGEYIRSIDPYMVVNLLLYKGQFYVGGSGLGMSLQLADGSGRRVHKINPYNYGGMHAAI